MLVRPVPAREACWGSSWLVLGVRLLEQGGAPASCHATQPHPPVRLLQPDGGEWVMSSWEQDEEIVKKLKGWTDNLMLRRFK